MFFEKLTISLCKAMVKHENLLVMDGFNVDVKSKSLEYYKRDEYCDQIILAKLIKSGSYRFIFNKICEKGVFIHHCLFKKNM